LYIEGERTMMVFEDGMLRGIFGAKKDGVSSRVEKIS
jgi:hypothetical protein